MSATKSDIEETLSDAEAVMNQETESESPQEETEDLSEAFAEFDEDYRDADYSTPEKKPEQKQKAEEPEEEEEEDVEEESEEEPAEEVEEEEAEDQSPSEPTQEELVTMLADLRAELQELRAGKAAEKEEKGTEETQAGRGVSREDARKAAHSQLVEQYQLDQEAADKMLTEPEAVLPVVAANLHLSVVESTANLVKVLLPKMIQEHLAQTSEEDSFKTSLAKVDKSLAARGVEVEKVRKAVLSMNPDLKGPELAQMVARVAKATLDMKGVKEKKESEAKKVKPKARVPAAAKAGSKQNPGAKKPQNEYALMAEEDLNEAI